MEVDAAGANRSPISAQALEGRSLGLDEREKALAALHEAIEARSQALEARFAAREAALQERESQIDDLRQANQKLVLATLGAQELRDAAQAARRRQDIFLAMLAHELRNPLAAISATVEIVARKAGALVPEKLFGGVRRQIRHLVRRALAGAWPSLSASAKCVTSRGCVRLN